MINQVSYNVLLSFFPIIPTYVFADFKNASKAVVGKEKLGKKDKRDFSDLFELPLECTTLGTCHVSLASFIDGETLVSISTPCIEEKKETENNSVESAPLTAVVGKTNGRKKEKGEYL